MKKTSVFLIFFFIIFFVSGEKLATFDNIYRPYKFQVEGNDLYVVDGSVIKLISMKDFKFITQFGKKGEGPGEFKYSPQIVVFPDQVFVSSRGKVTFFTRNGKLINEKRVQNQIVIGVYRVKGNYFGAKPNFNPKKLYAIVNIKVLDSDFNIIKEIYTYTFPKGDFKVIAKGLTKKQNLNMLPNYFNTITDGDFIFIGDTNKGFFIEIYDHEGNRVNTIKKNIEKLKVSDKYKKKEMDKLKKSKNWDQNKKMFNYIFPKYFPAYKKLIVNNNKIYVLTYKTDGEKRELIILDFQGDILKKTFVPEEKYYNICNNKFYYFVDNEEDEVMEFHSIDL